MTVTTTTTKVERPGNGVATVFSFSPIVIFASGDLEVTFVSTAGVETVLSEGVGTANYSVSVSSYPGTGSITYPASGSGKLASGEKLVIKRVLDIEQQTDLQNQGGYFPDVQEQALDRLTMIALQQQEELDRTLKVRISSGSTPSDTDLDNLETVAGIASNVTTVAGISADVSTVAGIAPNVTTVAGINAAHLAAVAAVDTEVATVAGISADVSTVAGDSADIQTLAANIATIAAKANADLSNVAAATGRSALGTGQIFNVVADYGADPSGGTDATTAIQSAWNAAVAAGGGTVYIPTGQYSISTLDFTDVTLAGITVRGDGWQATKLNPNTAGKNVIDLTGSLAINLRDFQIGAFNTPVVTKSGIFCAQVASNVSNQLHFENLYVTGSHSEGALVVYAVPSWDLVNCDFYNYNENTNSPTVALYSDYNASRVSEHTTVLLTTDGNYANRNMGDVTFTACEIHSSPAASATVNDWALTLERADNIRFFGGNIDSSGDTYVKVIGVSGASRRIVWSGTSFYSESGNTPDHIIDVGAALFDFRLDGCRLQRNAEVFTGAGAVIPGSSARQIAMGIDGGASINAGTTWYLGPTGSNSGSATFQVFITEQPMVIAGLRCFGHTSPGAGESLTFTVMTTGAASTLTATLTDTNTQVASNGHIEVAAGVPICVRAVSSASANAIFASVLLETFPIPALS